MFKEIKWYKNEDWKKVCAKIHYQQEIKNPLKILQKMKCKIYHKTKLGKININSLISSFEGHFN